MATRTIKTKPTSNQIQHMVDTNIISPSDSMNYSDLMVMRSNAGYYIGTMYHNPDGYDEPGSRDSEYFLSREAAQSALDGEYYNLRMNP